MDSLKHKLIQHTRSQQETSVWIKSQCSHKYSYDPAIVRYVNVIFRFSMSMMNKMLLKSEALRMLAVENGDTITHKIRDFLYHLLIAS